MNPRTDDRHPLELLPEYVNGRLGAQDAAAVRAHLDGCEECRTELGAWRAVSGAAEPFSPASVSLPAGLADRVSEAVAREVAAAYTAGHPGGLVLRFRWLAGFVAAQAPLVRREIWPASTVVMFIGAAVSLIAGSDRGVPGAALSLLAPLAAALGVALIYGQENDPGLELALATPTSPRLVVVARLVVVLAWDLTLALAASAVLAVTNGPAVFVPVVSAWLGPMLLLGCLVLLLSLFVHSSLAIATAMVVWVVRAMAVSGETHIRSFSALADALNSVWQTSPATLALALALLVAAVLIAPYREPFGSRPSI